MRRLIVFICVGVVLLSSVLAQSGFNDDRVMLQGFYWESYRHGNPAEFPEFGKQKWYEIVADKAKEIREGRFELIWLPPTAYSGKLSAGYNPKEYFNLNNSYGNQQQHEAMLKTLLENGIEPIADIVINHRDGTSGWAEFKNPDWGLDTICSDDEAFTNRDSDVYGTENSERGNQEEWSEYAGFGEKTYQYASFRDIDHTNKQVRRDIIRYLKLLQSVGYRGWRYDMVHGFHAKWIGVYNREAHPTFSVGEYDWGDQGGQRGWVFNSAVEDSNLKTASSVFDFQTMFTLRNNKGTYKNLYSRANGIGLVGDNTDGLAWKNKAVTFLENHDTGYRTNEDGTPQDHHKYDSFSNSWEVEQAYAYILTHPGIPTVYWKHYFDWGNSLQSKIKALINARKVAGVNSGSDIHIQENARADGVVYAAMISGAEGNLYIRIGGNDKNWQPYFSGYSDYREYARGAGWKVWVGLLGNPEVRQAEMKKALPKPSGYELLEERDILDIMLI